LNRLKAWYVTLALAAHTAVAVHAAAVLLQGGFSLPWAGALLATSALPVRIAGFFLVPRARTSRDLPVVLVVTACGLALALSGVRYGLLPATYAAGALGSAFLYVYWYSRFGRTPSAAIAVGAPLPDFELQDTRGRAVRSASYLGSPAVFLFYRGAWCPLCMAQIREIAAKYGELERRGVKVVLVARQSQQKTEALAARFGVRFDYLVDPDGAAARRLGIEHVGGTPAGMEALGYETDTTLPTLLVVDANGRIVFSDQTDNYRVRPDPQTFLALLDTAAAPRADTGTHL
jgi:peroxiredoxin